MPVNTYTRTTQRSQKVSPSDASASRDSYTTIVRRKSMSSSARSWICGRNSPAIRTLKRYHYVIWGGQPVIKHLASARLFSHTYYYTYTHTQTLYNLGWFGVCKIYIKIYSYVLVLRLQQFKRFSFQKIKYKTKKQEQGGRFGTNKGFWLWCEPLVSAWMLLFTNIIRRRF